MEFSDDAVRQHYEQRIDEFRVQIPLVRYEIVGMDADGDTAIIDEIYRRATRDKTTLAEALATMDNVPQNVSTTITPLTSLIHIFPDMRVRMEKLNPGDIPEPFNMNANGRNQYIVARVIEYTNNVPFNNMKDQLRGELLKTFVEELRKKYQVVVYDDMLNFQVGR
jgi:hypothetical protein